MAGSVAQRRRKAVERGGIDHARERLERENQKLKETIGELTLEFKKRLVRQRNRMNSKANEASIVQIKNR